MSQTIPPKEGPNLYAAQGEDFEQKIPINFDADNYTFFGGIRKYESAEAMVEFMITRTPNDNEIIVSIDDSKTLGIKPGTYVYVIMIRSNINGQFKRAMTGTFVMDEGMNFPNAALPDDEVDDEIIYDGGTF